jgi:hypothetical protein
MSDEMSNLLRMGVPRRPADLLRHRLIGYDRDDTLIKGFTGSGSAIAREQFAPRTDDHIAYGRMLAAGVRFPRRCNSA